MGKHQSLPTPGGGQKISKIITNEQKNNMSTVKRGIKIKHEKSDGGGGNLTCKNEGIAMNNKIK